MIPAEEFRRHAAECKNMANFTHDRENKAVWNRMAERWLQCAEWAQKYTPAMQNMSKAKSPRATMSH
jgi:phytoene/squalene synthetase